MRSKLYAAYCEAALTKRGGDATLPASVAPGRIRDYITTGDCQQPVLLLSCASTMGLKRPPISLQHLSVEFGIRFRVRAPAGVVEGDFVVLSLRGDDLGLAEVFCSAAEALLSALPDAPSTSDIERSVRDFIEILSSLSVPSSRAVVGLWAELWLMSVSMDPQAAVAAWHGDPTDRFDFSFAENFVEVKATEREERNHEFSYEQLRSGGHPILIVSLRLRRAQRGKSIADLVSTLQEKLDAEFRIKLIKNVFSALGGTASESFDILFDEQFAEANLRVIAADRMPVVMIPEGSSISAVRFRVNLDDSSLKPDMRKPAAIPSVLFTPIKISS